MEGLSLDISSLKKSKKAGVARADHCVRLSNLERNKDYFLNGIESQWIVLSRGMTNDWF